MSKHSIEERLSAVQRYLNGEASTFIEKQTGINRHDIIVYAMRRIHRVTFNYNFAEEEKIPILPQKNLLGRK